MGCFKGNGLLTQIKQWHEGDEHQKIIDAIEALPQEKMTAELVSLLARAYNNLEDEAHQKEHLEHAIALLKTVEETLKEDHNWNFRMAYAYYYLDREGEALPYFEKALELREGDEDTVYFIDQCRKILNLPLGLEPFRSRVEKGWASFLEGEAALRRMMDAKEQGDAIVAKCTALLLPAFADVCFELGFNGEKYDLILSPEGNRAKLFQLLYFKQHAPAAVLERWNILLGRQASLRPESYAFEMFGQQITAEDVLVWVERTEKCFSVALYCEKLRPLLAEDENKAWWMLSIMLDQVIGEVAAMNYVDGFDVLQAPAEGEGMPLDRLSAYMKAELALEEEDLNDAERYCESYIGYQMKPAEGDGADDPRMDVYVGSTACAPLINEYLRGEEGLMNMFHRDGVVPGFLEYPLDGFTGEDRGAQVLDFRDALEQAITEKAGADAVTFIGGASGVYDGYLDFIAWDLKAVLDAAYEVLADAPVRWAGVHTFRRSTRGTLLKDTEEKA